MELRRASALVQQTRNNHQERVMLRWAVIFLVIAIIAGILGFSGVAAASAGVAKVLFGIFLICFLLIVVFGLAIGRRISS
jgi:uncharacterized membrane protein YtjA (UPF0391 family)